jgi:hypothetical protein
MDLSSNVRTPRPVSVIVRLALAHGKWGRTWRLPHISIAFPAAACEVPNIQFEACLKFFFELRVAVKHRTSQLPIFDYLRLENNSAYPL